MTKEYRCMLGIQEMTVFSFLLIYVIKVSGLFLGTYKFLLVFFCKNQEEASPCLLLATPMVLVQNLYPSLDYYGPHAGFGAQCALDSIFDFRAIYIVCLFVSYASHFSFFSSIFIYLSPPLLISSFENRSAPFPGWLS